VSATQNEVTVRRSLRAGDAKAIADLHRRVYGEEYGFHPSFADWVTCGVAEAVARGWPEAGGGLWMVDLEGRPVGCLALTHEERELGKVRWFLLAPELRGRGLGRSLLAELLEEARAQGMQRLELMTFSALESAARLYREAGFQVVSERESTEFGPFVIFQDYELELR
jgi:GNAT superfamily N-acetyltransferase